MNLDRCIVVDVETSGLDPRRHGVIEIGACELVGNKEFSSRVRLPWDLEWDAKAALIHGLDEESCRDLKLLSAPEVLEQFFECFGWREFLLAGQNPHFDLNMLRAITDRHPSSQWPRLKSRVLDMHSVAIAFAPWARLEEESGSPVVLDEGDSKWDCDVMSLDAPRIYELLGMDPEPLPHRAINGARWERDALRKMLGLD